VRFARDESFDHELIAGRIALIDPGKASVENERGDAAEALRDLRRSGEMEEDVFHTLEEELDWAELAASPPSSFELVEG
jgi:ribosome recycling factor